MAADGSVTLDMSIDDSLLNKAINALNQTLKNFSDQSVENLSKIDAEMSELAENAKKLKIEPTAEGMKEAEQSLDSLNATIANQEALLENYQEEYEKTVKKQGEFSTAALKMQKSILSLEDSVSKNIKKSDEYAKTLGDIEDVLEDGGQAAQTFAKKMGYTYTAMQSAGKSSDEFSEHMQDAAGTMDKAGDKAKDLGYEMQKIPESSAQASEGSKTFEVALGSLIANGIQKAVSAIGDLLDKTQEYRKDMSFLNQNAIDAGVSLDITSTAMRNLNAITGETDSNVEAISNLLAAGFTDNNLLEAVDALSGAVIKFPDTLKIESLADSLQEITRTGEATGQFAELIGRLGYDIDDYKDHIERMSEAHRTEYNIELLLKSGLTEVNERYRENNQSLIEAANAEYDYNEALAQLSSTMEPLKTGIMSQFTELLNENKDTIQDVITAIGGLVEGILNLIDGFLSLPKPVQVIIVLAGVLLALILKFGVTSSMSLGLFAKGVASGAKALNTASPAAMQAGTSFGLLALEIMGVVIAVALLVAAFAALISAIKGTPKSIEIDLPEVPSADSLTKQLGNKGYAFGTRSAASGYRWVGESGPELVRFNGGEEVLTANQSMALRGRNAEQQNVYNYTTNNTFKVDDIRTYQQIEQRMKNERITRRMGYTGV